MLEGVVATGLRSSLMDVRLCWWSCRPFILLTAYNILDTLGGRVASGEVNEPSKTEDTNKVDEENEADSVYERCDLRACAYSLHVRQISSPPTKGARCRRFFQAPLGPV